MGKAERRDEYSCFPRELRLKGLFLSVFLLFFSSLLPLQGDEIERRESLSLNALLGQMMERTPTWSSDLTPWEWLLNLSSPLGTDKSRILALSKIFDALKNDVGMGLTAGYVYNSDLGIPDLEEGPYRWRAYAGLEWDFLQGGLRRKVREKERLKKDVELGYLTETYRRRQEATYYLQDLIIYLFAAPKLELLEKKESFLVGYADLLQKRVKSHETFPEELLDVEQEIQRSRNMISVLGSYRATFQTRHVGKPVPEAHPETWPVAEVKAEELVAILERPPFLAPALKQKERESSLKFDFLDDVRLRTFIQYQAYDREARKDQYFSLGVSVAIPFPFRIDSRKNARKAETLWQQETQKRQHNAEALEALNRYYEYKVKLDDLIHFLGKRRVLVGRINRLKGQLALSSQGASWSDLYENARSLLDVEIELLEIRQQLAIRLAQIFRTFPEEKVTPYLSPLPPPYPEIPVTATAKREERPLRGIYVWSKTFLKRGGKRLLEEAKRSDCKEIFLSFPRRIEAKRVLPFLEESHAQGIRVYAVVTEAGWLKPAKLEEAHRRVMEIASLPFDGLHADIEPHTLDRWKRESVPLAEALTDLLSHFRTWIPKGWELSVALSPRFPEQSLERIYGTVDKVGVMAYGETKPEKLGNLLEPFAKRGKERTLLILRPNDFSSLSELEALTAQVRQATGIESLAFHDMERWISWEKTGAQGK